MESVDCFLRATKEKSCEQAMRKAICNSGRQKPTIKDMQARLTITNFFQREAEKSDFNDENEENPVIHDEVAAAVMYEFDSLENSGCKRLRISSLIDMQPDQDDLYDLCASANSCAEDMRSKGINIANWEKMVGRAFDTESVGALNFFITSMQT